MNAVPEKHLNPFVNVLIAVLFTSLFIGLLGTIRYE